MFLCKSRTSSSRTNSSSTSCSSKHSNSKNSSKSSRRNSRRTSSSRTNSSSTSCSSKRSSQAAKAAAKTAEAAAIVEPAVEPVAVEQTAAQQAVVASAADEAASAADEAAKAAAETAEPQPPAAQQTKAETDADVERIEKALRETARRSKESLEQKTKAEQIAATVRTKSRLKKRIKAKQTTAQQLNIAAEAATELKKQNRIEAEELTTKAAKQNLENTKAAKDALGTVSSIGDFFDYKTDGFNPTIDDLQKKYFEIFYAAKKIINSKILVLLGLYSLIKNNKLIIEQTVDESLERILRLIANYVGKNYFIELSPDDEIAINMLIASANNKTHIRKYFDEIIRNDNIYCSEIKAGEQAKCISIMGLLWILHLRKEDFDDKLSTEAESILKSGSQDSNIPSLIRLLIKISQKLKKIYYVYKLFYEKTFEAEDNDFTTISNNIEQFTSEETNTHKIDNLWTLIVQIYNDNIKKHKSMITILKIRDDSGQKMINNLLENGYHPRFHIKSNEEHVDKSWSNNNESSSETPLYIDYNDTPLILHELKKMNSNTANWWW